MKKPFYILWGRHYNPVTDSYVEKMLGCYQNSNNAERMANKLRSMTNNKIFYMVKKEYFCDEN